MKTTNLTTVLAALLAVTFTPTLHAQNDVVIYQGRVQSGGTNFTGTGQFKFALFTVSNAASTAMATAVVSGPFVVDYIVTHGGNGYATAPVVTITGGGGSGANAVAVVSGGVMVDINPVSAGSGYTGVPTVIVEPAPATTAYTTDWSNDGTSVDGSEPTAAVSVFVNQGRFMVRLGDPALTNPKP